MISELLPRDGLILCAVSGGADSVYLLLRLREMGFPVAAAHFNHGIRGQSADGDEEFVRALCRERGIVCVSEKGDAPGYAERNRLGLEAAGRALRYAFLERTADALGASVIATAHNADDNAETVLMHLARGAGLHGLCGIPPVRGRIVRPMLDESHEDALLWLKERGIGHREDETNASDSMTRNRIRHSVIPLLLRENPALNDAVFHMTSHLREDDMYLNGLAEDYIRENAVGNALPAKSLAALPRPVSLRVIRHMAGAGISAKQAEAVLYAAEHGGYADISGMRVGSSEGRLVFGAEPPSPLPDRALHPGRTLRLPEAGMRASCERIPVFPADVHKSFNTFFFKYENIYGNMTVGARRPGDGYRPARRNLTKSLKQLFLEADIPAWQRDAVPVIRDERGILGVYGFPEAERVCACPGDTDIIRVDFNREDFLENAQGYRNHPGG